MPWGSCRFTAAPRRAIVSFMAASMGERQAGGVPMLPVRSRWTGESVGSAAPHLDESGVVAGDTGEHAGAGGNNSRVDQESSSSDGQQARRLLGELAALQRQLERLLQGRRGRGSA